MLNSSIKKSRKKKVDVNHSTIYDYLGSRKLKIGPNADYDLFDITVREIGIDRANIKKKKLILDMLLPSFFRNTKRKHPTMTIVILKTMMGIVCMILMMTNLTIPFMRKRIL